MCLVGSFFKFYTLARGTEIIGVISVIGAVGALIVGGMLLFGSSRHLFDLEESKKEYPDKTDEELQRIGIEHNQHMGLVYLMSWVFIAEGALVLFVTIFLFVAVKTKRNGYLLPWLVVHGIIFFVAAPLSIVGILFGGFVGVWFAVVMAYAIYLYIVVLSYYKSLAVFNSGQVPVIPSTDQNVQLWNKGNPPGEVGAMPPASSNGLMEPSMDSENGLPLKETMPSKAYPQQYTHTPPPYSQV